MSNNRLNCCKKENICAYMFLHQRVLGENPVNAFPSINVWGTKFLGYTGPAAPGYTGPNGFTICGISFDNTGYGNEGIPAEYELWDTSKLLVNLPGHYIKWDGSPDGTETNFSYHVGGTLILPTKYSGITLNNSEKIGEDLYYKYFGGYEYHHELFDPITGEPTDEYDPITEDLLLSSYKRHSTTENILNCYGRYRAGLPPAIVTYLTGNKCDDTLKYKTKDLKQIIQKNTIDSKHTFYIKVEYSDVFSEYLNDPKSNIFYSVVLSSGLQEGSASVPLLNLLRNYPDFMCGINDCWSDYSINIPPVTNRSEMSNAAWSSIPESIQLIAADIQFCGVCGESENNTKDVINLVDTQIIGSIEIQLAVPTTRVEKINGVCPDSSLGCQPPPNHPFYALLKTEYRIPIQPEIHSRNGLGFGMSWDEHGICQRYQFPLDYCDGAGPCSGQIQRGEFCCPSTDQRLSLSVINPPVHLYTTKIAYTYDRTTESFLYPGCFLREWGTVQYYQPNHLDCSLLPPGECTNITENYTPPHCCDVPYPGQYIMSRWGSKMSIGHRYKQDIGCYGIPGPGPLIVVADYEDETNHHYGYKETLRGSCQSDGSSPSEQDCCACSIGNCGSGTTDPVAVVDILQEKSTTTYEINPYLMIDEHGAYFSGDGIPDFLKYINHISSGIWKTDRINNDADIGKYTLVSGNNSKCSNYFITSRPHGEYYMWNKQADTRSAALEWVCDIYRFKNKGPNPWEVDSRSYKLLLPSGSSCDKARKHQTTDWIAKSFEKDPYTQTQAPRCWKELKHKYPLVLITGSDGITHYALTGITVDDCLDLGSIQFVKDQAEDYTFPQPTIYP